MTETGTRPAGRVPAGRGAAAGAAVRPLRFERGALVLLDQTALPAEERWLRCRGAGEVADAIRRLAVRGAPAIGIAAAYGLALGLRERGPEALPALVGELAGTRPTAVNLRWALERVRAAAERAGAGRAGGRGGAEAVAAAALAEAEAIAREQLESDRRLAAHGVTLLAAGDRVLTHCNTGALATGGLGTAGAVLAAAWPAGRLAHVWVGETRPLLQGSRLTAWELGRAGIPLAVVPDAAAGSLMARGEVDRVIVGADRIAASGDVANKIGTYPLAVLAARHRIPFLVAAPRSTIDPDTPSGERIEIERRDPGEVTGLAGVAVAPPGAAAVNPAFDVTPAELVTAIVTEAGVHRPPYARSLARAPGR